MRAVVGSTRWPMWATSPSTLTRPSSISSSHARRDPTPARARTFWSLSDPSASDGPDILRLGLEVHLGSVFYVHIRVGLGVGFVGRAVVGLDVDPQTLLERLDHVGTGDELGQRRQLVERVDAESLEQQRRGAEEHGLAGARIASHLVDVAA